MKGASKDPAKLTLAGFSQDFFLGLAIVFFGVLLFLWLIPAQVNDAGSFGLPPSLAPKALALVMIACGTMIAVQNVRTSSAGRSLVLREVVFLGSCLLAVGLTLLIMGRAGEAIDRPNAGFLIGAPLGLIAFTFLHSRAPVWAYAFNAIVAPLVIIAAFWWGLELPLP